MKDFFRLKISSFAAILFIVWIIMGVVFLFQSFSVDRYEDLYNVCLLSYLFIGILVFLKKFHPGETLFDSFTLISILYILMMCVVPMQDIITGNYYTVSAGLVDVFPYGLQATLVFDAGYFSYYLGYSYKHRHSFEDICINDEAVDYKRTALYSGIVWTICFASVVGYLISTGKSLSYIISAGVNGAVDQDLVRETPLMFLSVPGNLLIPTAYLNCKYGKNKIIKFLMVFLTVDYFWLRGFRYSFVIMAWSAMIIYYISKRKKPKVITIAAFIIVMGFIVGVVGGARRAVREGSAFDFSGRLTAVEQILDNFRIYKTYYAVVKACPSMVPYNGLNQIVGYTIIMFIPRAIWPGKPATMVNVPIVYGLSEYSATAGAAYPNVGEYYYSAGIVGVILFMLIWGIWNRKLEEKMCREINTGQLIVYSVILASNFQLVIRGYTPSNFYMLLFSFLPIFLVCKRSGNDLTAKDYHSISTEKR